MNTVSKREQSIREAPFTQEESHRDSLPLLTQVLGALLSPHHPDLTLKEGGSGDEDIST